MLLPSINITAGAPDNGKATPSGEKGMDSAAAFSAFLPLIMSAPNPSNIPLHNSAEPGAATPVSGIAVQGPGSGGKHAPALSDIVSGIVVNATHGWKNPPDKTAAYDARFLTNIIGRAGIKAGEDPAETVTGDGKAGKGLPDAGGFYEAVRLKPAHLNEPAGNGDTAGHQRTPQKTEGPVRNNPAPGKGTPVNTLPEGSGPGDPAASGTDTRQHRRDADIPSRPEGGRMNENSFVFQKTDIPETDSRQTTRNSSNHRTGDNILAERPAEPAVPQIKINKTTPSHKPPSVELTIEPEGLGKIDIEVSVHDGKVRAELGVEKLRSLVDIQNSMPQLFDSLAKAGLTAGGFSLFLKNRGYKKWVKPLYNQKTIKDIALNPQKSNHGNPHLYTVSIRV